MNQKQIEEFFKVLSEELNLAATVILTGAAAGKLMGNIRPSMDVDFAIFQPRTRKKNWEEIDKAVQRTIDKTRIQANYAENIDRWGMITLLDYESQARFYKKFNNLRVLIMDPAYWAIGKMTRYLDTDRLDILTVFKKKRVPIKRVVSVWSNALKRSPRSASLLQFINHAQHFFLTHGKTIWGKRFSPDSAIEKLKESSR